LVHLAGYFFAIEEAAKLIHRMRSEIEGPIPFVAVNCATITGSLVESPLFSHRKGAFTGADEAATGYIAEADGGILFLDEFQTLSIPVQQKLLRVLNDGTYHRLGGSGSP
jgi:transcriptional regulator with AAA-type ATPase domain